MEKSPVRWARVFARDAVDASRLSGSAMRYRAIAVGLRLNERPVQVYGDDIIVIREWAQGVADNHGVPVDIMATEERLLERVGSKKEGNK